MVKAITHNYLKVTCYQTIQRKTLIFYYGAMDDKGKIAFKQGFVNQLIGDEKKVKRFTRTI